MSSDYWPDPDRPKRDAEKRARKQQSTKGQNDGWTATGTLLSGIIVWGGIGWLVGLWTGWVGCLPIGVIIGAALGVYLVVKQADDPPPLLDVSKGQRRSKYKSAATIRERGSTDK